MWIETTNAPVTICGVRLRELPSEAGTQETTQAPITIYYIRLRELPSKAGVQETTQAPICSCVIRIHVFPKAGIQETTQAPVIEATVTLKQIVIELLKMLSDGNITTLESKNVNITQDILNRWFKMEVEFRDCTDKTVIFVKLYDLEGNVIAQAEFETTELHGLKGSIGLYNSGKVYFDLFECRYV